jgi:hypothetical protein
MIKGTHKINVEADKIDRFLAEGYEILQQKTASKNRKRIKLSVQPDVIQTKQNHSIELNSPEDLEVDSEDDLNNKLEEN